MYSLFLLLTLLNSVLSTPEHKEWTYPSGDTVTGYSAYRITDAPNVWQTMYSDYSCAPNNEIYHACAVYDRPYDCEPIDSETLNSISSGCPNEDAEYFKGYGWGLIFETGGKTIDGAGGVSYTEPYNPGTRASFVLNFTSYSISYYYDSVNQGIAHIEPDISGYNVSTALSIITNATVTIKSMSCIPFNPSWRVAYKSLNYLSLIQNGKVMLNNEYDSSYQWKLTMLNQICDKDIFTVEIRVEDFSPSISSIDMRIAYLGSGCANLMIGGESESVDDCSPGSFVEYRSDGIISGISINSENNINAQSWNKAGTVLISEYNNVLQTAKFWVDGEPQPVMTLKDPLGRRAFAIMQSSPSRIRYINSSCSITFNPTNTPTKFPSNNPSFIPTNNPSNHPTLYPTVEPSIDPTFNPSNNPSVSPSKYPSITPTTINPTRIPSINPSDIPTFIPSNNPSINPTNNPTQDPTNNPTINPTNNPSLHPTNVPSINPTQLPTNNPTNDPTIFPSGNPSNNPSKYPSNIPSIEPTNFPTINPTDNPSVIPSKFPSNNPTLSPNNDGNLSKNKSSSDSFGTSEIIIVVSVVVFVCCIIGIFAVKMPNKKMKLDKIRQSMFFKDEKPVDHIQLNDVNSDSNQNQNKSNSKAQLKQYQSEGVIKDANLLRQETRLEGDKGTDTGFDPEIVDEYENQQNHTTKGGPEDDTLDPTELDIIQNDLEQIQKEKQKKEDKVFGQVLGDGNLVDDIMVDDIVNEIDGRPETKSTPGNINGEGLLSDEEPSDINSQNELLNNDTFGQVLGDGNVVDELVMDDIVDEMENKDNINSSNNVYVTPN